MNPNPTPNQVEGLSLGPRYMCFHQGRHVCYVVNELSSQVTVLQYHPKPSPNPNPDPNSNPNPWAYRRTRRARAPTG